jgi:hypothetical protein
VNEAEEFSCNRQMPADPDVAGGSHCQLIEHAKKRVELYRKRMKKIKIKPKKSS